MGPTASTSPWSARFLGIVNSDDLPGGKLVINPSARLSAPRFVEVNMAGHAKVTGKAVRPPVGRDAPGTSGAAPVTLVKEVIEVLKTPFHVGSAADIEAAAAQLEETRSKLLADAGKLDTAQQKLERTFREFNVAHGNAPRLQDLRQLGAEVARDLGSHEANEDAPVTELFRPIYATADQNMRAAAAAAADLPHLEGEALQEQHRRLNELITAATILQERGVAAHHERSAAKASKDQTGSSRSGSASRKSAFERIRRPDTEQPEDPTRQQGVKARVGRRVLPDGDARHRLDRNAKAKEIEEERAAGHPCFGSRILNEPFPTKFSLPRDTAKYNGETNPEDWLVNYTMAVDIAGGNKRVAVRYVPLMLEGAARMWLNSLEPGSIDTWPEFREAFTRNFGSTYRRPGRPYHLAACKQRVDESDRDYLTRWNELRNTCEDVHEVQAISYFIEGCIPGTMLHHKLHRTEPKSLKRMLEIAEKYASADAAIKAPLTLGSASRLAVDDPARRSIVEPGTATRRDRRNDKRKDAHTDVQYGSAQVAAVENAGPAPPPSRRQRAAAGGNAAWSAKGKYTFESMLDSPCKFHSGGNKPATHTTRQCGWMKRASNGEGLPAAPPLPAPAPDRGAPAPAPHPPRNNYNQNNDDDDDDRRQPQGAVGGRLQVQATYHVFTSERNDKRAQRRRAMEVNAVAHTGHRYMDWSHRPVAWDRSDHPDVMPTPGGYALVVDTMIIADSAERRRQLLPRAHRRGKQHQHPVQGDAGKARHQGEGPRRHHYGLPRRHPRPLLHAHGQDQAGCRLRHAGPFPARGHLVRSGRPAQPIPHAVGQAGTSQVHGSTTLRVPEAQDARSARHHNGERGLQKVHRLCSRQLRAGRGAHHRRRKEAAHESCEPGAVGDASSGCSPSDCGHELQAGARYQEDPA